MTSRFLSLFVLFSCLSCNSSREEKLNVAVAANMRYAMEAIVKEYETISQQSCNLIVGSSGNLTSQILENAPYDIFFSADTVFPKRIEDSGKAIASMELYARGILMLWSKEPNALQNLREINHQKIALANPEIAPYGMAARQVLDDMELTERINNNLVYGQSIAQVNQFISTGSVEYAFTSKSSEQVLNVGGYWTEIPQSNYKPILQGTVIIKNDRGNYEKAIDFLNYLNSEKGRNILSQFGYLTAQ